MSGKVCGIMGYNYIIGKQTGFDTIEGYSIEDALEDVLERNVSILYDEEYISHWNERMEKEFSRQIEIAHYSVPIDYYDISKVKVPKSKKQFLYFIIGKIAGDAILQKLHLKFHSMSS